MRKIFVLNGLPESGKTTFGRIVGEELAKRGINFIHTSSIDPVKQILLPNEMWSAEMKEGVKGGVLEILKRKVTDRDWDGVTKDEYWRKAMSELKREITQWNSGLIPYFVLAKIQSVPEPLVAFVDIREPENIKAFQQECLRDMALAKVETILVESDLARVFANRSDESVHDITYDHVINNDRAQYQGAQIELGLQALSEKARGFIDLAIVDHRSSPEII